jgi:hypothetical protein
VWFFTGALPGIDKSDPAWITCVFDNADVETTLLVANALRQIVLIIEFIECAYVIKELFIFIGLLYHLLKNYES